MATYASPWETKKWSALASLVVLAAVGGTVWWLSGGCESETETEATPEAVAQILKTVKAMSDGNVIELSLQVAWFHALKGRLPSGVAELPQATRGTGWPPPPTATTSGFPITYRPTGERSYELVLPGEDKTVGTADDVVLAQEAPADSPSQLTPIMFRSMWALHQVRRIDRLTRKAANR